MREDYVVIHDYFIKRLLMPIVALVLFSITALAQTQPATTKPPTDSGTSTPAAKRTPRPEDEIVNKLRAAKNDPQQSVELIVKLVKEFPDSMGAESAGFSFASAIKKQVRVDPDPSKLRGLASRFIEGTASAPGPLRVRANTSAINVMLDNNLASEAVDLTRQTISVLDEKQFLVARRKAYERDIEIATKANPNYKPKSFDEADFVEMFRGMKASYYALLGRGLLKLDKDEEAEKAYRQAFEVEPIAPAASGLATILEKRGKDREALEYMALGMLTGKLDRDGIAHFRELYRKTHSGKLDGAEEYLDASYRESYRNPVKGEKYRRASGQSQRTVLAEFFTGAGCVPCIPFDFSFESMLEDYSRKELVLLVYHWHAPTMDPLGNRSADARVKYYDIHGAPTTFVDGRRFTSENDDSRSKSAARSTAQMVYGELDSKIKAGLKTRPQGQIKLAAQRVGENVEVNVSTSLLKNVSSDVTLQLALIENEAHYSGENGLRFHAMVVRDLARRSGAESYGFKVDQAEPNKFAYAFNIKDIIAQNLRYYTEYPEERRKEFAERVGAETAKDIGIDFSFKEERNLIDPNNLSVVAFLQDNKTKEILQSAYLRVAPSHKRRGSEKSK